MHDFIEQYAAQRQRAWPQIQAFFDDLPDSLVDLGWEFAQRLARRTAPSGEFSNALEHPAVARVAYLPLWHLMAVDFLRSDPECRESWEVQRTGVWGQDLLLGDTFSRALVVEVLAELNRSWPGQAEGVLNQYRENGWRYYRDFKALPPDIDDIAQAIRLLQFVEWDAATRRAYLATPLRWLASNRAADGGFPVWLTEGVEDRPSQGWVPLGGRRCLACEANLLDALGRFPGLADDWIVRGVASLLERWAEQRYSGIYYYKPAYGACLIARCFAGFLEDPRLPPETGHLLSRQLQTLSASGDSTSGMPELLSLAASLQISAFASHPHGQSTDRALSTLMTAQSFDGGWESTDFFRCPGTTRQGIGWHGSRLLTTSQSVRALVSFESGRIRTGRTGD